MGGLQVFGRTIQREALIVELDEYADGNEVAQHAEQRRCVDVRALREIVGVARAEGEVIGDAELRGDVDGLRADRAADELTQCRLGRGIEELTQVRHVYS